MHIHFSDESKISFPFSGRALICRVIRKTLKSEGFPYEPEISVILTTNERIREVNREMRNIDSATDVLSFPALEYSFPGSFGDLSIDGNINPETGEILLGDIMLSAEKVKEQAKLYGHSEKREMAFLIAHSMLHLFGYDHETKEDRILMEEKQEKILSDLKITRDALS